VARKTTIRNDDTDVLSIHEAHPMNIGWASPCSGVMSDPIVNIRMRWLRHDEDIRPKPLMECGGLHTKEQGILRTFAGS